MMNGVLHILLCMPLMIILIPNLEGSGEEAGSKATIPPKTNSLDVFSSKMSLEELMNQLNHL